MKFMNCLILIKEAILLASLGPGFDQVPPITLSSASGLYTWHGGYAERVQSESCCRTVITSCDWRQCLAAHSVCSVSLCLFQLLARTDYVRFAGVSLSFS